MDQSNINKKTDEFIKQEQEKIKEEFEAEMRMDRKNYENAREREQQIDEQLRAMEQLNAGPSEDFDFNTILEKETRKAHANDRRSPSSPVYEVPTIENIKRLLDPKTIKKVEEYYQSGVISLEELTEIAAIANDALNIHLEKHPENINNEEQIKDIWQRVFIKAVERGKADYKNKSGGKRRSRRKRVPRKYIPKRLTRKDKRKQSRELKKSRKAYKKGKYYTRKKVKSFKSKVSPHIVKARKMYKIKNISASPELARKTGCSVSALRKIVKKGQGAYYSSGSRPNQTGHSWGRARLASAITGGKAAAVDYHILEKGCKKNSKALRLAKRVKGKGTRRVKKLFRWI